MSYDGAVREGLAGASSLADVGNAGRRVRQAEAGRRCVTCHMPLARLNRDSACFACLAREREAMLLRYARPLDDVAAARAERDFQRAVIDMRGRRRRG